MGISPQQFYEMEQRLAINKGKPLVATQEGLASTLDNESKLHDQILAECNRRLWAVVHSRMDKRSTTGIGVFDFVIAADKGRVFWVEAKIGRNKLSKEQLGFAAMLKRNGHVPHEVRSFTQFLQVINEQPIEHSRHD